MYLILFISLLVAAYTDYRSRTIPVWLFPLTAVLFAMQTIWKDGSIAFGNILSLFCMFIPTFTLGIVGKMGGGDILMFSVIGFLLGYDLIIYIFILSGISTIYYFLILKSKNVECPLAPFALVSYVIYLILQMI